MEHRIERYPNGNIKFEQYRVDGKLHRNDGPAAIEYYENGDKKYEEYLINGKYHRNDGPAIIKYSENGNIQYEEYYLNGNHISLETVQNMIKDLGIPEDHINWDQVQKDMFQFHFLSKFS